MASEKAPIHSGHRARMRNRFFNTGLDGFQPHEILEMLLFCPIPKRDVNPLAHALLDEFGSIDSVLSAPADRLESVDGIGAQTGEFFAALNDVCSRYTESCFLPPQSIQNLAQALRFISPEARRSLKRSITILFTDRFGRPIALCPFPGRLNDPALIRAVIAKTLTLHSHSAIIFCTGFRPAHPLTKSELDSFQPLVSTLAMIDAFTIDFILLSGDHLLSLRRENLLSGQPTDLQSYITSWPRWLGPLASAQSDNRWYPVSLIAPEQI